MTVENNKKTAIVTGAAGGMGLGIAERLGRDGFNVVLADIQADLLAESVNTLKADGLSVEGVACDIGVQGDVQDLAAQTRKFFGPIDVVINNAGISPKKNGKKGKRNTKDKRGCVMKGKNKKKETKINNGPENR